MSGPPQSTPKPLCAREIAWRVVCDNALTSTFAADLLDDEFRNIDADPSLRRLTTQISLGTIRQQLTLDVILRNHISRPQENVEPDLWNLLRVGAFQVVFMSTAPHAAVNETVNVTHRNRKSHWSKFLNGVLRSILRNMTEQSVGRPSANTIPMERGKYRVFNKPLFPDPADQAATFLSQAFSFPEWMVNRWLEHNSPIDMVQQLFYFNAAPPLTLRLNKLQTDRHEYEVLLNDLGISFRGGQLENAITIVGSHPPIYELPGFNEGWFCVQDEAAMAAGLLLDPQPGEMVLDLCAAPGTKTTHLAELMNDNGTVVATDVDETRLSRIRQNADRLGLTSVQTEVINRDSTDIPTGPFDAVLVDVPCSNTGVLARRPEARWRLTPDDFTELAEIQVRLLHAACERVRAGGRVVYSTCSIDAEENQAVVKAVCNQGDNVTVGSEQQHYPGRPADGAWQCLLRVS